MSFPSHARVCVSLLAALALHVALTASALACGPFAQTVYIGNTATDSACNYNSLAAAMAAETCPNVAFVLTSEVTYNQPIVVDNRSLTLGAYPVGLHCGPQIAPTGPTTRITLDVTGSGQSAVSITGSSSVSISNLQITGGTGPANRIAGAGGVNFSGDGSLRLSNVNIHHNTGSQGGVMLFGSGAITLDDATIAYNTGSGGTAGIGVYATAASTLTILDDANGTTSIHDNTTPLDGGGIGLYGPVHLQAVAQVAQRIEIYANTAQAGAGVDVGSMSSADIGLATLDPSGSGTTLTTPTGIHGNSAQTGAGINVEDHAVLHLFNTRALGPTVLSGNAASDYGGGLVVGPSSVACVWGVSVSGNSAKYGSAVYLSDGARLYINPPDNSDCNFPAVAALGAVQCSNSVTPTCSRYAGNYAPDGSDGDNSVIEFTGNVGFQANHMLMTKNIGGSLVFARSTTGGTHAISNSLLAGNTMGNLVYLDAGQLTLDGVTFAANGLQTGQNDLYIINSTLAMSNTIMQEAGGVGASLAGTNTINLSYVLATNLTGLTPSTTVITGDPQFVSPGTGDFHLMSNSIGIDFAPATAAGASDLDGDPRTVDLPGTDSPGSGNNFGPRDLGAYEFQIGNVHDRIFLGTFE